MIKVVKNGGIAYCGRAIKIGPAATIYIMIIPGICGKTTLNLS